MLRISSFTFILFSVLATCGFATTHKFPCHEESDLNCSASTPMQLTLDAKVGYFSFSDGKMSKIFDRGGLDVQLSGALPVWRWLQVYGSVEYWERSGKSLNGNQSTNIWSLPLSLGLKPVIPINRNLQYFFSVGPRFFFVNVHNKTSYFDRKMNENGLGGFVNMGLNFISHSHLLASVFGEYSYGQIQFHPRTTNSHGASVQVGGYTFGVSLGYAF